jgi:extracellular elastinolytic metalloproteinase
MRSYLLASLATLATFKTAQAHPHKAHALTRRGVDIDSYRMKFPVAYKNATAVVADPDIPTLTKRATAQDTATEMVKKSAPGTEFRLVEHYTGTNGISHFFYKQTAHGIDIDNGDFNVNVSIILVDRGSIGLVSTSHDC